MTAIPSLTRTERGPRLRSPSEPPARTVHTKNMAVPAEFSGQRGAYPRPCSLSVLAGHAEKVQVYDAGHVSWCISQFMDADPSRGGEETLDADLAAGVAVLPLAARVPADNFNAGATAVSAPGATVGPTSVWMKTANTADGFGGLRGRSEWLVPPSCTDEDCRVLFLHGGSYQWYSGTDQYYRPFTSRVAAESGMPVLAIDYRLSPEHQHPAPLQDGLDALRWLAENGPNGPSRARKIFVAGDSSGGGMCLALALAALHGLGDGAGGEEDEGGEGPARPWTAVQCDGVVAICPLTDISYDYSRGGLDGQTPPSHTNSYLTRLFDAEAGTGDPVFTATLGTLEADKQDRQEVIRTYSGDDTDLTDPLLSPVFAGPELLSGLCACMLLAADEDLTVDDAVDFAENAKSAGVEIDLVVWPRVWHDWLMCTEGRDMYGNKPGSDGFTGGDYGTFREAEAALDLCGTYLKALAVRNENENENDAKL